MDQANGPGRLNETVSTTMLSGTMNETGFVDIPLSVPIVQTTHNERVSVALTVMRTPDLPNVGIWGAVGAASPLTFSWELRERNILGLYPNRPCGRVHITQRHGPIPPTYFGSVKDILTHIIERSPPRFIQDAVLVEDSADVEEVRRPSYIMNVSDHVEILATDQVTKIQQKASLQALYTDTPGIRVTLVLHVSPALAALLPLIGGGGPYARLVIVRPVVFDNMASAVHGRTFLHLMMDDLTAASVNGRERPVLYSFPRGNNIQEPRHLVFVTLNDTRQTGSRSERRNVRLWLEDGDGQVVRPSSAQDNEFIFGIQWKRGAVVG